MHQTSTRIMKVTPEGRPFTRDFKDLFSTLVVSLTLKTHRVRFKNYPFSFTTEEAVANLSNLKFAQSNRMPDPNDPTRIVTTTTTTTFSMAPDMAKGLCQRFMEARFFESANDKSLTVFKDKSVWVFTAKGIRVLDRFCQRNGIQTETVKELTSSAMNSMQLVLLERDPETDAILESDAVVEIIFRRFAGKKPNIRPASETETGAEYATGLTGVRLVDLRKMADGNMKWTFSGKSMISWILDCSTALEAEEAMEIARMFLFHQLILYVGDARGNRGQDQAISGSKYAIYQITAKGRCVAGWEGTYDTEKMVPAQGALQAKLNPSMAALRLSNPRSASQSSADGNAVDLFNGSAQNSRETNTARLQIIMDDAALRSQFSEFLRENYCEENLSFYIDVREFQRQFKDVKELESVSEGLARAYSIYNAFLASGSPCELNLDHSLRLDMAAQMTRVVGDDAESMRRSLQQVAELYDRAQNQVFRLMAGDSVPKFLKTPLFLNMWNMEQDKKQ
ncbi:regulator of G protein signaling domain-domain-containing protein [Protomyces lactucae-debilis]|uniref:Regulator of G protein signaling domain-domain-containing protein n=1 Tax=Protomyces lactucae-debilis TaxID=2754530 RepID=A0A1Y2FIP8_PROLT|nr:regulator of G protein signaling domain-containing protein [Protomyces lactucae-debilis]ORY82685.1 regulator of G protein signaling domain-domain-containing protein [Protomyces lactucae-debilis]